MTAAELPVGLTEPEESLEDVPEYFRPVAKEHGRALFMLVYASGIAQHGLGLLGAQNSREVQRHLQTVGEAFNRVAKELITAKGWTEEEIESCDRAIRYSMDSKIVMPRERGIILDA